MGRRSPPSLALGWWEHASRHARLSNNGVSEVFLAGRVGLQGCATAVCLGEKLGFGFFFKVAVGAGAQALAVGGRRGGPHEMDPAAKMLAPWGKPMSEMTENAEQAEEEGVKKL